MITYLILLKSNEFVNVVANDFTYTDDELIFKISDKTVAMFKIKNVDTFKITNNKW